MARYKKDIFARSEKFFLETEQGWDQFWNDAGSEEEPFENDDGKNLVGEFNVIKYDSSKLYKRPKSPDWLIQKAEIKKYKDQSTQTMDFFHVSACTQTDETVQSNVILVAKKVKTKHSKKSKNKTNEKEINNKKTVANETREFEDKALLKTILDICIKRSKTIDISESDIKKFLFNIPALHIDFSYYSRQTLFVPTDTFLYARDSDIFSLSKEDTSHDLREYRLSAERYADCVASNASHEEADVKFMDAESNESGIDLEGNSFIKDADQQFVVTGLNFDKSCVVINGRIVIDKYSWNTLVSTGLEARRRCTVCSEETSGLETLRHLELKGHKRSLMNAPPLGMFGENLIRQINETTHCAICNRIVSEAPDHINDPLHILRHNWAVEPDSPDKRKAQRKEKSDIQNEVSPGDLLKVSKNKMVAADDVTSSVEERYETQHPKTKTNVVSTPETEAVIMKINEAITTPMQSCSTMFASNEEKTMSSQSQIAPKKVKSDPEYMVVIVRGKKYILSSDSFHCLITFADSWYCMVCNATFPLDMKSDHTSSEKHCKQLLYKPFKDEFGENIIRKLDSKFCHCCTCNRLIPRYAINGHFYDEDHKLLTRKMLVGSTPRNIQMQERADQNNSARVFSDNVEKVFVNMEGVCLRVDRLSWHGVIVGKDVRRCVLCHEDISAKMIDSHLKEPEHERKTLETPFLMEFGEHLIRKVNETWRHCAICNKTMSYDEEHLMCHIQGWTHLKRLNLAKDITDPEIAPLPEIPTDRASEQPFDMTQRENILRSDIPSTQSDLPSSSQDQLQSLTAVNDQEQLVMLPTPKLQKQPKGAVKKQKMQEIAPQEYVVVTFHERTFIVSNHAWYGISKAQQTDASYCHICGLLMPTELVKEHKDDPRHRWSMSGTRFLDELSGHLFRQLQSQLLSCVTCNVVFMYNTIDQHMAKIKHNNKLRTAQDISVGMELIRQAKVDPIEHIEVSTTRHIEIVLLPLNITMEILESKKLVAGNILSLQESKIETQSALLCSVEQQLKDAPNAGRITQVPLDSLSTSQMQHTLEAPNASKTNFPVSYNANEKVDSLMPKFQCSPTETRQGDVNVKGLDATISSGQKENLKSDTIRPQHVLVAFRADKFIISSDAWHAVNSKSTNVWCCYLCDTKMQPSALEEHKVSAQHVLAMGEAPFLSYDGQLLRQLKLGIVNCLTCHTIVPPTQSNIDGHIAGRKHKQLLQKAKDTFDDIDDADRNSIKRITISVPKVDTKRNVQESSSTATGIPESSNDATTSSGRKENTKTGIVKQPRHVLVTFSADEFIISSDAWYAVNSKSANVWCCYLCSTSMHPSSVREHKVSTQHALAMQEAPFLCHTGHLFRKLKLDKVHCLTCHTIITQIDQHITGIKHKELLQMAKEILAEIDDADLYSIKRVTISVPEVETEKKAQESNSTTMGIPKISNDVTISSGRKENITSDTLKQPLHIVVMFRATRFVITDDAWYAVNSQPGKVWCCYICGTKIQASALEEHLVSAQHALGMREAPYLDYTGHLLRQLKLGITHCLTCHTIVPANTRNVEDHIAGKKHKQLLLKAKDIIGTLNGADLEWTNSQQNNTAKGIPESSNKAPSAKKTKRDYSEALKGKIKCDDQALCVEGSTKGGATSKGIPVVSNESNAKGTLKDNGSSKGPPVSSIGVPSKAPSGSAKATVESANPGAEGKKKALVNATLRREQQYLVTFCGKTVRLSSNAWFGIRERIVGTIRCFLCGVDVDRADLESHKKSVRHHMAMMDTRMLEDYTDHFIREVSPTLVNCLVCNIPVLPAELAYHTSATEHTLNLKSSQIDCHEQELSDTTEAINIDLLMTSKSTDYCILYNPDVSLSAVVTAHAWHGLKEHGKHFMCLICNCTVNKSDLEEHKDSVEHRANLERFLPSELYPGELVRKLQTDFIHCVTCNVIVQPQDIGRHIKKGKHGKNLLEARSNVLQMRTGNIVNFSHHILQEEF